MLRRFAFAAAAAALGLSPLGARAIPHADGGHLSSWNSYFDAGNFGAGHPYVRGVFGAGGAGYFWRGRWWGFGAGPCWRQNPFSDRYIWVCD